MPLHPSRKRALTMCLKRLNRQGLERLVCELAALSDQAWRSLEQRFDIHPESAKDIIRETRIAIAAATDFDERDINRNFSVDYEAYERVERGFKALVRAGRFEELLELGEELIKSGSYQVEMSDEGLMADDIRQCLAVVFRALKKSEVPLARQLRWVWAIEQRDGVGIAADLLAEFWKQQIPVEAWSELADSLVRQVAATKLDDKEDDREWRLEPLLNKARQALIRAGRADEAASLKFPERSHAKRMRRKSRQ